MANMYMICIFNTSRSIGYICNIFLYLTFFSPFAPLGNIFLNTRQLRPRMDFSQHRLGTGKNVTVQPTGLMVQTFHFEDQLKPGNVPFALRCFDTEKNMNNNPSPQKKPTVS